jgi:hypothetical protein
MAWYRAQEAVTHIHMVDVEVRIALKADSHVGAESALHVHVDGARENVRDKGLSIAE